MKSFLGLLLSIIRTGLGISASLYTSPHRADYTIILFRGATPLVSAPSLSGLAQDCLNESSHRIWVVFESNYSLKLPLDSSSILGVLEEDTENRVSPKM